MVPDIWNTANYLFSIWIVFSSLSINVVEYCCMHTTLLDGSLCRFILTHHGKSFQFTELVELLKSTNLSSISDINPTVSHNLNKGPLSRFHSSMFELLDNNMNLCKAAAGSLNTMKTQVKDTQTRLIAIKRLSERSRKSSKLKWKPWLTLSRGTWEQIWEQTWEQTCEQTANDQISEGGSEKEEGI